MRLSVERSELWSYEERGEAFFHPRVTVVGDDGRNLLMTLQTIGGSDYFGHVQFAKSNDDGETWSEPELIPDMGRVKLPNGIEDGVCDVVPDFHERTGAILAVGHNVLYKDGRLYDSLGDFHPENGERLQRYIVYTVMKSDGEWVSKRKRLECAEFADCSIYSCGCSQKVILPNGNILIPVTFGCWGRKDRLVTSILCSFDGETLTVIEKGSDLENPVGRGLLEPSLVKFGGRFYMTIRAEDERGHVSVSEDGLNWSPIKPWTWEDETPLRMSTTQQHWLTLGGKLFLVYTRDIGDNTDVMRWRSPLLMAEVDIDSMILRRDSETVVLPIRGDAGNPDTVGLMGNFHAIPLSENEAIATVGEMRPRLGYTGDTLLARIRKI